MKRTQITILTVVLLAAWFARVSECQIDGTWRGWSPWVATQGCSVSCGGGNQPYTRSNPPQFAGQPCQGNSTDSTMMTCNNINCPIDGVWGIWSPWVPTEDCSVTCGGGSRPFTRVRVCTQPQFGGQECHGSPTQSDNRLCQSANCPIIVDGVWSEWTRWVSSGQCNVTCAGGYQPYTRSRVCNEPQLGGEPCRGNSNDSTKRVCNNKNCPLDGIWREWTSWVPTMYCSVTCGGGRRPYNRTRECRLPQFGGQPCQGSSNETIERLCNTNNCPIVVVWGDWTSWIPTKQCSVTCGAGIRSFNRSRSCILPQFGGQPCQGSSVDSTNRVCNTQNCVESDSNSTATMMGIIVGLATVLIIMIVSLITCCCIRRRRQRRRHFMDLDVINNISGLQ